MARGTAAARRLLSGFANDRDADQGLSPDLAFMDYDRRAGNAHAIGLSSRACRPPLDAPGVGCRSQRDIMRPPRGENRPQLEALVFTTRDFPPFPLGWCFDFFW